MTIDYDPMLAKVVAHGADRESARRRMIAALEDFLIIGPPNNLTFLRALMETAAFRDAAIDTQLIEREGGELEGQIGSADDRGGDVQAGLLADPSCARTAAAPSVARLKCSALT